MFPRSPETDTKLDQLLSAPYDEKLQVFRDVWQNKFPRVLQRDSPELHSFSYPSCSLLRLPSLVWGSVRPSLILWHRVRGISKKFFSRVFLWGVRLTRWISFILVNCRPNSQRSTPNFKAQFLTLAKTTNLKKGSYTKSHHRGKLGFIIPHCNFPPLLATNGPLEGDNMSPWITVPDDYLPDLVEPHMIIEFRK